MARCAVYVPASFQSRKNMFGVDVANLGFFRALAESPEFSELWFLLHRIVSPTELEQRFLPRTRVSGELRLTGLFDTAAICRAGTLLRGTGNLSDLAWLRRETAGDQAYSLVGLIHCIAPPALRQQIAECAIAPIQPWDALICTSPAVQQVVRDMLAGWSDYLGTRLGGNRTPRPAPLLPLIPLGVDCQRIAAAAERPKVRSELRARLGVSSDEILVLWVGRMSFFEKAFPQPMFEALEEAARHARTPIHFVMAGWFPNPRAHRALYEQAARAHAPSVRLHFIDGTARQTVEDLWAAADIFLSLVDNIQETFGITPIEAMAAGLPAVVTDWNGYRSTVRNNQDGFLVPTLGAPPGLGRSLVLRHVFGLSTYQNYAAEVAQHTAINVTVAGAAIASLANDPDLRRRMGAAGKARTRAEFDWPVVMKKFSELASQLREIRQRSTTDGDDSRHRTNPIQADPFAQFATYASNVLKADTVLRCRPGQAVERLKTLRKVQLNAFGASLRADHEAEKIVSLVATSKEASVQDVLARFARTERRRLLMTIMWLCKIGMLDWETPIHSVDAARGRSPPGPTMRGTSSSP
jgi:glycosyltransferase involved in cell wall biosynthesis